MEKRKTAITTLMLTSALFSVVIQTNMKDSNNDNNLDKYETSHEHLPEGWSAHNAMRKRYQFFSQVEV